MELSDLIDRYGFYKLVTMELDESGRISRNFARPNEYTNVLYAIVVNSDIKYIGKASCLWKRFDTYRNCVNWSNAFQSNVTKTKLIEKFIEHGLTSLYIKRCPSLYIGRKSGASLITTMHDEEPHIISVFNPEWNVHYANPVSKSRKSVRR